MHTNNDDVIRELALVGLQHRLNRAHMKRTRLEQAALELKELEAKNAEAQAIISKLSPVSY